MARGAPAPEYDSEIERLIAESPVFFWIVVGALICFYLLCVIGIVAAVKLLCMSEEKEQKEEYSMRDFSVLGK